MKKVMLCLTVLMVWSCSVPAQNNQYVDGVYEGEHSFVKVRVSIEEGTISNIEILHHGGGGEKYEKMVEPLTEKIIEAQSTQVDGISGATVSSDNLKTAVDNALLKALPPARP